jgi:acetate kinase
MPERTVLTINTGSSSLKAAIFDAVGLRDRHLTAQVEHIGHESALVVTDGAGTEIAHEPLVANDHGEALSALIDWLHIAGEIEPLAAIGHRLVHGGAAFTAPARIDSAMIATLESLVPFAPNHMPQALAAIAATRRAFPALPQIACFDTAFHRTMPPVAQRYPLPPEYERAGVIRYGFHGLSYASIVDQLGDRIRPRTVIAHLGNGASMVALRDGKSVDTTMGFTPLGGLMMGTRSGDLDPGVMLYLLRQTGKSIDQVADLVTNQAGLRGVSQSSADMKTLLDHENDDPQTAIALELYVALARKQLGGLLAVLGGIDLLVFTGGVGEHAAPIRERICAGFEFAGIRIDPSKNDLSSSRPKWRDLSLPEHPSSTSTPAPTVAQSRSPANTPNPSVILNEVKDLSPLEPPAASPSTDKPPTEKQEAEPPRGENLRVAQNDSGGEGDEPETGSWGTRGPSTSLGMTEWVETKGGTEISYDDAFVRVVVLPSDEERMIARDTVRLITGKDAS